MEQTAVKMQELAKPESCCASSFQVWFLILLTKKQNLGGVMFPQKMFSASNCKKSNFGDTELPRHAVLMGTACSALYKDEKNESEEPAFLQGLFTKHMMTT